MWALMALEMQEERMGCDVWGKEKCWGSSAAENSDSALGDLIYPTSAHGL